LTHSAASHAIDQPSQAADAEGSNTVPVITGGGGVQMVRSCDAVAVGNTEGGVQKLVGGFDALSHIVSEKSHV